MDLNLLADRLNALGNPTRLATYRALVRAGPKGLPVGVLQGRIGIPASTLSHHLAHLVRVGLVRQDRLGTILQCHADFGAMNAVLGALRDECCSDGPPE